MRVKNKRGSKGEPVTVSFNAFNSHVGLSILTKLPRVFGSLVMDLDVVVHVTFLCACTLCVCARVNYVCLLRIQITELASPACFLALIC